MGKKKHTYEYIKAGIEKEGYELLSKTYINSKTKLKIQCPEDHICTIIWSSFNRGIRCEECGGTKKLTYKYIKMQIEKDGYRLLSKIYKNNRTKLKIQCNEGHTYKATWGMYKKGRRCPICFGTKKYTYTFIKTQIEKENYKLLDNKYVNNFSPLKLRCNKGHICKIRWSDFRHGVRCSKCFFINNYGENNPSWKGGIACEPYCNVWSDKEYKEDIRIRDGHKCLNPNCSGVTKRLCLHHINYNKKDCFEGNLITVCRSCNSMANTNRSWHTSWYKAIIRNRYGGNV